MFYKPIIGRLGSTLKVGQILVSEFYLCKHQSLKTNITVMFCLWCVTDVGLGLSDDSISYLPFCFGLPLNLIIIIDPYINELET